MPTESPAGGFPAAAGGQAPATAPSTGPTPAAPDGVDGPTASTRTLLSPRMRSAHRSGVGWWHPPKARPRVDGARHRAAEGERSRPDDPSSPDPPRAARARRQCISRPRAGLRRGVRRLPRPHAGRRGEQPGRAALLRRRRPAHPARARAGQPHEGADPGRAGARARGRARRRGPQLLLEPRLRPDRHRAGRVEPDPRRRRRRLHDHPAVRQEHPRRRRALAVAQVQGTDRLGQGLPGEHQGPDPRRLPQRHLLRPRRLRHPGGEPGLLRQERAGPDGRRGRGPRRRDPVAVALGPGREPGPGRGALEVRPRRHGLPGLAHPGTARRPTLPDRRRPHPATRRRARGRRRAHRLGGDRRAGRPRHHRAGRRPARAAHHHDDRPDPATAGRRRRPRRARGSARQPAQRARRDRPPDRRHPRLLRRRERPRPRLRAGRAARGLHVQAVRRARRPSGGARRSGSAPRSRASRCPACATTRARAARTAT